LTPVAAGVVVWVMRQGDLGIRIPQSPDYGLTKDMGERLLVTIQRLVLPPLPVDFKTYATLHKLIGVAFLGGLLVMILTAPRGDRRRGMMLLIAVVVALAPFLPVEGDHVRRRFAYFGTVFAAGLAAYMVSIVAERVSPRVTLPVVLAILVGLLLEQQAEFERDYMSQSIESQLRARAFQRAANILREDPGSLAVFAGDPEPNLVTARSTLRVVSGCSRDQLISVKVHTPEEFAAEIRRLREKLGTLGTTHVFIREIGGYGVGQFDAIEGSLKIFDHDASENVATKPADVVRELLILLPKPVAEVR
jgi:hypothetical protein